jgi:hypothetical protein
MSDLLLNMSLNLKHTLKLIPDNLPQLSKSDKAIWKLFPSGFADISVGLTCQVVCVFLLYITKS